MLMQQTSNGTTSELAFPNRNSAITRVVRDVERDGPLQVVRQVSGDELRVDVHSC